MRLAVWEVERFQYEDWKNGPFCAGEEKPRPCPTGKATFPGSRIQQQAD